MERSESPAAERVREILQAITIVSPTTYRFANHTMNVAADGHGPWTGVGPATSPATPGIAGTPPAATHPLVLHLTQQLYQHCYCSRFDGTLRDAAVFTPPAEVEQIAFSARLSAGNTGQDRWDTGWRIMSMLPSGQVLAQKGDRVRVLWGGEFVTIGSAGVPPAPGAGIQIYMPHESWTLQPGYYYVLGTETVDAQDDRDLIRVYWNVGTDEVASLVQLLTHTLNRFTVPFRFKCQVNPAAYARIDGTVLFVSRRYYHFVAELIETYVLPGIGARLDTETPLFTKRLAPGLSVAEDPGTGESFGMHRCRLLAEGALTAFEHGDRTGDGELLLAAVVDRFKRDGLDLEHPYLNAGSRDVYTLGAAGSKTYAA